MSVSENQGAFLALEFPVEVWLAAERLPLARLLELQPGGVLRLKRDPDGPVDLVVNGSTIASGELVVVDSKFGFRVTSTAQQRLAGLGSEANGGATAPADPPDGGGEPEPTPETPAEENPS